ncbi:hypothetical protein STRTUCAR8_02976, partial [Streptomyces turgidiscabies Car8]
PTPQFGVAIHSPSPRVGSCHASARSSARQVRVAYSPVVPSVRLTRRPP